MHYETVEPKVRMTDSIGVDDGLFFINLNDEEEADDSGPMEVPAFVSVDEARDCLFVQSSQQQHVPVVHISFWEMPPPSLTEEWDITVDLGVLHLASGRVRLQGLLGESSPRAMDTGRPGQDVHGRFAHRWVHDGANDVDGREEYSLQLWPL